MRNSLIFVDNNNGERNNWAMCVSPKISMIVGVTINVREGGVGRGRVGGQR